MLIVAVKVSLYSNCPLRSPKMTMLFNSSFLTELPHINLRQLIRRIEGLKRLFEVEVAGDDVDERRV